MLPKKLQTAFAAVLLLGFQSQAQLNIQSGATFFMQTGAQVTVQGNVDNAGTLTNDGSLRVQGNYANTGTYTGVGTTGVLEMYGTGNSNLTPGSSALANLLVNKTGAADVVTLTASTTVNNGFTLTNGVLTTNPSGTPSVVLISPAATPYSFAAGKEIIGSVRRTGWANGTARVFNQPNMLVTTNAGTAPTDLTVTMVPNGDPTQTEREVKRKFGFAYTGGSGFTADVRYPYIATELNTNVEANLVPWTLVTSEWNSRTTGITRNAANDWVNITTIPAAELPQEWKLADPNYTVNATIYLRGAWNATNQNLNTTLNSSSLLPLTQPYNQTQFDSYNGLETVAAGFFASRPSIVDWILVDVRKNTDGSPANTAFARSIGRKAGFLLSNGTIVGMDGITPISFDITKQGPAFLVLKHRNHLAVMSNQTPSSAAGAYTNDFTVTSGVYDNPAFPADPMQALASSVKFGMWAGNATRDGFVNTNDVNLIRSNIVGSVTGYAFGDVNMDGVVNTGDLNVTRLAINGSAQTHSGRISSTGVLRTNREPQSHVPSN